MSKRVYKANMSREEKKARKVAMRQAESIRREVDSEYDRNAEYYAQKRARNKARLGCLIVLVAVVAVIAIAGFIGYSLIRGELDGDTATATEPVSITISSNTGASTIGRTLADEGVIGNADIFRIYVRFFGSNASFKAGTFTLEPGMSYDEIIETLSQPPPARPTVEIKIQEGSSIMSVAAQFEAAGLCTAEEFLKEADNGDFSDLRLIQLRNEADNPGEVFHRAEGYLYPDTYEFFEDETVQNIVRRLYEEMSSKFTPDMYTRMEELGLTVPELMTIASIIQAESGYADEMAHVSAVVWNRLGDGWADDGTMGMDTTHEYVMKWMQINLPEYAEVPRSQISAQNVIDAVGADTFYAYNTRVDFAQTAGQPTRLGLPAGPVCCFTVDAVNAALYPDEEYLGVYYYFLNDKYGEHYYAKTLAEHNANVAIMNERNAQYDREQEELAQQEGEEIQ